MIKLFYYPGNASLCVHFLLEELGAPYELVLVDRTQGAHKAAEYLKLNPNGLIPVLVDGDLVLSETAAILLHLCDTHECFAPPLRTHKRAQFYKWLMFLTNTVQAEMIVYFYPDRWAQGAATAEVKASSEGKLSRYFDLLEAQFAAHGGPYLLGAEITALDYFLWMLCRWSRGMQRPARTLPQLSAFLARLDARPAVARAYAQEQLGEPRY